MLKHLPKAFQTQITLSDLTIPNLSRGLKFNPTNQTQNMLETDSYVREWFLQQFFYGAT